MTIAIKVYGSNVILGKWQFLEAFFSTICYRLEDNNWGTVYPIIMNEFSNGVLSAKNVEEGYKEIKDIEAKMEDMKATDLIMDVGDLKIEHKIENINEIKCLKDCFVTIYGQSIFAIFDEYMKFAIDENVEVKIQPWKFSEVKIPENLKNPYFGV